MHENIGHHHKIGNRKVNNIANHGLSRTKCLADPITLIEKADLYDKAY